MSYLLQAIYETPWAILPAKLAQVLDVAHRHARGERLPAGALAAITTQAAARAAPRSARGVAVVPVTGVIIPRGNLLMESSGAVSATRIAAQVRAAQDDPEIGSIVLDIESPGGAVVGIEELGNTLFAMRGGPKPITAVANHLAASAAYWIAAAADEIVVTPSAEVGSIGVFAAHEDLSAMLEREGVKVTLVSAGKYKTEANPYEPLGDEARAAIQARVNDYYGAFVRAVARGRGVTPEAVRTGFGEGRLVGAREAVKLGMADRVDTLDNTIDRLMGARTSRTRASLEMRRRRLRLAARN